MDEKRTPVEAVDDALAIPFYAYGDNEAAVQMAGALREAREALAQPRLEADTVRDIFHTAVIAAMNAMSATHNWVEVERAGCEAGEQALRAALAPVTAEKGTNDGDG